MSNKNIAKFIETPKNGYISSKGIYELFAINLILLLRDKKTNVPTRDGNLGTQIIRKRAKTIL